MQFLYFLAVGGNFNGIQRSYGKLVYQVVFKLLVLGHGIFPTVFKQAM